MRSVFLGLDAREADALDAAADYLEGFARVFELLGDERYPGSDLRDVVGTLRTIHARAAATLRAA